ncbi:MAG: branched-chain amino acid transport system substrate-binding protein [Thermoleophilaceae bacterium]|nr:branched-chain amino acid transport system substrate-binding protein [Thermoleophilaceae bacterium]
MRVRWFLIAALSAIFAMGVAACGSSGGGGSGGKISGTQLTIYSSLPEQGASGGQAKAIENGAKLAVQGKGGKVGKYSITYKPLDDSLASSGSADEGKGRQNARTAVSDKTTIAYLGEYNSGISKVTIPILNRAGIAQVSPANTYVGLTTNKPGSEPGEPDKYYPSGKRTYARVVPPDTIQGAALAQAAQQAGCKAIHIWNSKTTYATGLARNLSMSATKLGLKVEGNDGIDPKAANYRSLAANVKADCFIYTGEIESNGIQAIKDVASANTQAKIFTGDGTCLNDTANPAKGVPANIASRVKCTIATLDPKSFGPEGKKFFADYVKQYKISGNPDPYAIYGFEATNLILDAIQRASTKGDLTRQGVVDALYQTKNRQSVLGTYSIDQNGDTSLTDYGLYKIVGGKLVFDRVLKAGQAASG